MRLLRGVLAAVVMATGMVLIADVGPAHACSCVGFSDQEAFDAADVVFTGTLENLPLVDDDSARVFSFVVESVHKGDAPVVQVVRSQGSGSSCGLEIGGRGPFVVFATALLDPEFMPLAPGELYSGLCSGTRPLTPEQPLDAAIAAVARPPHIAAPIPPAPDDDESSAVPILLGAAAVLVVGAAALTFLRARRRPSTPA